MTTRREILSETMTWLRTPYHHRARIKGSGVDCAQILIGVFSNVGLVDPFDPGEYPRDWMMHQEEDRFRAIIRRYADQIEITEVQPGDVALYMVGKCFAHGAIIIDWPLVVHADSKFGSVSLAEGNQGWLADRPVEFYRVKGL